MPKKTTTTPKAPKEPKAKAAPKAKIPKATKEPKTKGKTLVFERADAILRLDSKGRTAGIADQMKKISKESSPEDAERWFAEHCEQTKWARTMLTRRDILLWDTETTGVKQDAEIVDLGACRMDRSIVLNTLIKPEGKISSVASLVHGITAEDVASASTWAEVWPSVALALSQTKLIVAYNDAFDRRLIMQACYLAGLPEPTLPPALDPELMIRFANWVGDWDPKWQHYKWHKLESGHRALGDSLAMIDLLERMASSAAI